MFPQGDWWWLRDIINELPDGLLESRQRKLGRIQHSRDLERLGIAMIKRSENEKFMRPHLRHLLARDGAMTVFLAVLPLRRKNFAALRLGFHLRLQPDGSWRVFVPAEETKNRREIDRRLSDDLALVLNRYLAIDRPALLQRGNGQYRDADDHLWISDDGKPLTPHSITLRICEQTRQAFGKSISPHLARDCAATTVAIELPQQMWIAAPVLGDRSLSTVEDHYNQAGCIDASRRVAQTFRLVRENLKKLK